MKVVWMKLGFYMFKFFFREKSSKSSKSVKIFENVIDFWFRSKGYILLIYKQNTKNLL